jgi:hypothetical protein
MAKRQLTLLDCKRGVPKAFSNVLGFKVGMLRQDLVDRHPVGDHCDDRSDREAESTNSWQSTHPIRVDGDASERHGANATPRSKPGSERFEPLDPIGAQGG